MRRLTKADSKALFYLRNNLIINKYIKRSPPKTIEQAFAFITKVNVEFTNKKNIFWGIECKQTNKLIGSVCLWRISKDTTYAELGYELHPDFHNKAFMTEILQKVIHFAFYTTPLKTIEAFTHKDNKSSIALLNKLKFVFLKDKKDEGFMYNNIYQLNTDNKC